MTNLNHVGKVISNGRRCLVAYRTLPGDAFSCLIIPTESLQDSYHDALIKLVESNAAQTAFEFAEVLYRSTFPDGSNMLVSLHAKGHLVKMPTDKIEMIPNSLTTINLAELNQLIAQNKGVSVQDLAIKSEHDTPKNLEELTQSPVPDVVEQPVNQQSVLTDYQLAEKYRKDAAQLTAEITRLLEMAEQLSPTKMQNYAEDVPQNEQTNNVEMTASIETPVVTTKPSTRTTRSRSSANKKTTVKS